ncbi:hypothetical protein NC651_009866 [Populus alba x Populus x berolinensis]|nr:hypothetical protein NC651_009866 [Populus alba x Populus x berolinensis]
MAGSTTFLLPLHFYRRCRPPLLWLGDRRTFQTSVFCSSFTTFQLPSSFPHCLCNETLEK